MLKKIEVKQSCLSLQHAFPEKINNFFSTKICFVQHHLVFVDTKYSFCAASTFFVGMKYFQCKVDLLLSIPDYFQYNIGIFVLIQKCVSVQHQIFVLDNVQNVIPWKYVFIVSQQQKFNHVSKNNHLYVTQKINSVLCITKFLYSVFTLHIGSMLIFFLVVLETKKLLNDLLPL